MSFQTTNRKVLVVDDDAGFASDLKMWLNREGFHVHVAHVGRAAIQFYRLYRPYAVVLLDLCMPKVNGFEVLQEIRRTDVSSKVAVVTADVTARGRMSDLSVDALLVKPIGREAICSLVHRLAANVASKG